MAHILEITGRNEELAGTWASLRHFESREAGEIPSEIVIQQDHVTPYCLDHESRRLIFTELPPELDLTTVPFAFSDQWRFARRLIAVPYEELQALSKQVPLPSQLVFVFNASRSGTTLMSRILNQMDGVCSFAELDFFTNLHWLDQIHQDRDELVDLLYHCVRLFASPYADQVVCFKFRHNCVEIADLFHRAFPAAKNLFMYRNAIDWSASWRRFAVEAGSTGDIDRAEVRDDWVWVTERTRANLARMLDADQQTVPSLLGQLLQWIDSIEGYLRAYEQGVPFVALRYEDLNESRVATLELLLGEIGIPRAQLAQALLGFEGDSQAGTVMQRRGGKPNAIQLDEDQKRTIVEALAKHPRKLTSHPVLSSTRKPTPDHKGHVPDPIEALILDLLEFVGPESRPFGEVLEAWRTSCPRLPVWEEATDRGLLARHHRDGGALISLTPIGRKLLDDHRPSWAQRSHQKQ